MREKIATVRLQLHEGFDFDAAARIVPLLAQIGYSHVYTSPVLQSAHGSTHGYDVVDPTRVNDELGGEEGRARFVAALREHGMGWLLDIVPNHMEISDPRNAWWWDVLENGPSSPFASFFDIDWHPPEPKLAGVVLMPILGDHRGHILERREIAIERHGGFFVVRYFDHALPLAPRTLDVTLRAAAADPSLDDDARDFLALMADAHAALLDDNAASVDRAQLARRHRDKRVLRRLLAHNLDENEPAAKTVDAAVARINDDPKALDALLERQSYRLAWWRTSEQELDYRRFFDIDHLVALRMEDEAVFKETHALVLSWAKEGVIDGVRVDHVDGLADPKSYLERLRREMPSSWIVVEKILARDEALRTDWPVAGTTGYDFLATLDAVFVDAAGIEPLTKLAAQVTGDERSFADVAAEKKAFVLSDVLASDAKRVTALIARVCDEDRVMRDTTRHDLHTAVCALAAAFPVYRTYVVDRADEVDRATFARAVAAAHARHPNIDAELLEWLARFLCGADVAAEGAGILSNAQYLWSVAQEARARFQQLTAPAMAKGVEDTAFYAWHRLDSACEVGGDPSAPVLDVDALHRHNERAQERWPERLCTTSTHDTKRSEDVRARIAVLSELAPEWGGVVDRLLFLGTRHKAEGAGLDRAAEYALFQALVGTWPATLATPSSDYVERVAKAMQKSAREAKVMTSWTRPNEDYEQALARYTRGMIEDDDVRRVLSPLLAKLVPAARLASIAKALIKLASPGVPDVYQGCELWDESLVDPDNRRPVDWDLRARALEDLLAREREPNRRSEVVAGASWIDGSVNLAVIRRALALRARRPEVFGVDAKRARVRALDVRGVERGRCVAFSRGARDDVIVVVPRLVARFAIVDASGAVALDVERLGDTAVVELPRERYVDVLSGDVVDASAGPLELRELWRRFPAALLEREVKR